MNVIADLCIVPIGVGVSVSPYVAACQRILTEAGLDIKLHAYGTNIEGIGMRCLPPSGAATKRSTTWGRRESPPRSNSGPARTGNNTWPTKWTASRPNYLKVRLGKK